MKKLFILLVAMAALATTSCEKLKYHVYSIEIHNNTSKELRYVTTVKMGVGQDEYLLPSHDTIIYTERRMSKDFDGPSDFLSEYYSIVEFYFTGESAIVRFTDSADPSNYNPDYNIFTTDNAWNLEIREVKNPPKGFEDETYVYTFSLNEQHLLFDFTN